MEPYYPSTNFDNSDSVFGMGDSNFPWDFNLEDNFEAQKLLAAAIAHNDQYRYDEDQKRKLEMLEDITQQNPSKVSHNLNITSVPHPDLTAETASEANIDSHSEQANEPQKKKPGRKPLNNTPSSKRKAQNRAAQRAFRERKERYVKELENKIKELESMSAKSVQENQELKTLVEQLQAENFILKQTTFTFDFPLDKANDSTTALDKDISDILVPISKPTSNTLTVPTTSSTTFNSYTPPSSNVSDDEPSSPSMSGSAESDYTSEVRGTSSGNSPKSSQAYNFSPLEATTISPPPTVVTTPPSHSSKPQSAEEFCEKFTDGICQEQKKVKELSSSQVIGESSRSSSAFTEYRDPTPFTPNIDTPFSDSAPLPPLFEQNFQEFGSFAPMATPSEERRNPMNGIHSNGFASMDEISSKKFLSCNKVWERIQQHPMFDDLEGDEIDLLCAELKSKAKCSGNGPVVPEEDLEAVLGKLEDK
ncbi:10048_t:CDS:2 [Funneliformis caledonium]|uniref:10048_t:CDS:1 n=1 Tax=Funneliformis caledonium TaxID=1117310 RepID=A0A9N9AKN7_9GLOM|nr:10048_t:CDS:2 [Funneliformis caledonium]